MWQFDGLLSSSPKMRLAGYEFEHICDTKPLRDRGGVCVRFMPQDRYQNARNLPLNRYGAGPFCRLRIPTTHFHVSGVYVLTIDDDLRYVGECANLSARFNAGYENTSPKNCLKGRQETNCRLNNLVYAAALAGQHISLWFFQTANYKSEEKEVSLRLCHAYSAGRPHSTGPC